MRLFARCDIANHLDGEEDGDKMIVVATTSSDASPCVHVRGCVESSDISVSAGD